jgi:hypothetical protein
MIIRISTRNDFFYIEKRAFKIFNFEWWVPYKDYMFGYNTIEQALEIVDKIKNDIKKKERSKTKELVRYEL